MLALNSFVTLRISQGSKQTVKRIPPTPPLKRHAAAPHIVTSGLQLRFDGRSVDHGEHLSDLSVHQVVKGMLMKDHSPPFHMQAEEVVDRRAVEAQPGRDVSFIRQEEVDMEVKVGNLAIVRFEHGAVAVQTERPPVMNDIGRYEVA